MVRCRRETLQCRKEKEARQHVCIYLTLRKDICALQTLYFKNTDNMRLCLQVLKHSLPWRLLQCKVNNTRLTLMPFGKSANINTTSRWQHVSSQGRLEWTANRNTEHEPTSTKTLSHFHEFPFIHALKTTTVSHTTPPKKTNHMEVRFYSRRSVWQQVVVIA